ncbi:MAG: glycosyltransferase N-terminal domain-containing protein [Desulfosalsimonas sp.]|uniref:3-deoxy-D-manno-octulosonic acid transferase n=1 Tax=Desulfosalsimonas sp. TaxID=3073848 RepID=UPI003970BA4E
MNTRSLKTAIAAYDTAWHLAIPSLRLNARLKDGYAQRRLKTPMPPANLWIQAASAGEAYLACAIADGLLTSGLRPQILVTTNTRQGMEILEKHADESRGENTKPALMCRWFPFDRPTIMEKAVRQVSPKLVVLLETEIWPGLLHALKKADCPAVIINGRMTEKSLNRYIRLHRLLNALAPEQVLAISGADAARFSKLFGTRVVSRMPNIKFDRLQVGRHAGQNSTLSNLLAQEGKFLVLGSIRQPEEPQVLKMIQQIRTANTDMTIGLFPRHMHRIDFWKSALSRINAKWALRSDLKEPADPGHILLWDTFGELSDAYSAADAVFVGGSLAALGGQNFLEPLVHGVQPVIGPHWDNFFWVGETIFRQGLVFKEDNWQKAAARLLRQLETRPDRCKIKHQARDYIQSRQGGTSRACQTIGTYLKTHNQLKKL